MHAALSVYHIHDWVWIYYADRDSSKVLKKTKNQGEFLGYLIENECDDLKCYKML